MSDEYQDRSVEEIIGDYSKRWYWLKSEPGVLACIKATSDALDYLKEAGENASLLGFHRLLHECEPFLEGKPPNGDQLTDFERELAQRQLRRNVAALRNAMTL